MNNYFILPGLGNSTPDHWQSYFENSGDNFQRIDQEEWDEPTCNDWIAKVDEKISGLDLSKVVLIGHSLGCLAIVHWAKKYGRIIKGAMLLRRVILNPRNTLFLQKVLHRYLVI